MTARALASVPRVDVCRTYAVTGSKGGVGKSNLVVNLAVTLGRLGRRVLLVDGDLGLASLDVLLGLVPTRTLEHVVDGQATLEDLVLEGPEGVRVLPAASGVPRMAQLAPGERARLIEALAGTRSMADVVLVDTGSGLGDATLALQLAAERVIVVATPEPTALVDAYASLKVLWGAAPDKNADVVVNGAEHDGEATRAFEQIRRATRHVLGREPGFLGTVYRDTHVGDAVRRQGAVTELFPTCRASRCYERIAMKFTSFPADAAAGDYWSALLRGGDEEEMPH